ncbi:MAG: hypothetical protein ABJF23_23275 [Bryobacteraceae bacterium]
MTSLAKIWGRRFEDAMAEHLNRCFAAQCRQLGEKGVQDEIRYGIKQAAGYGISLERDVCKYIDLMFAFGRDFDRDLKLPWAAQILRDNSFDEATVKVERLFATAKSQTMPMIWNPQQ